MAQVGLVIVLVVLAVILHWFRFRHLPPTPPLALLQLVISGVFIVLCMLVLCFLVHLSTAGIDKRTRLFHKWSRDYNGFFYVSCRMCVACFQTQHTGQRAGSAALHCQSTRNHQETVFRQENVRTPDWPAVW